MYSYTEKEQENKNQSTTVTHTQKKGGDKSTSQFVDNRPEAIAQRKLQEMANNSPQAKQAAQLQSMADNHAAKQQQLIQKKENDTGLPDNLKTGMENLSGMSLDDVKVHHNSNKPAQLQAHAYAQGTDIHLGPGQEKHLPHETWHVVQQKQGRVKPTRQMKDKVKVNDDAGLEREADVMGAKALQMKEIDENNALLQQSMVDNHAAKQPQSIQKKDNPVVQMGGGKRKKKGQKKLQQAQPKPKQTPQANAALKAPKSQPMSDKEIKAKIKAGNAKREREKMRQSSWAGWAKAGAMDLYEYGRTDEEPELEDVEDANVEKKGEEEFNAAKGEFGDKEKDLRKKFGEEEGGDIEVEEPEEDKDEIKEFVIDLGSVQGDKETAFGKFTGQAGVFGTEDGENQHARITTGLERGKEGEKTTAKGTLSRDKKGVTKASGSIEKELASGKGSLSGSVTKDGGKISGNSAAEYQSKDELKSAEAKGSFKKSAEGDIDGKGSFEIKYGKDSEHANLNWKVGDDDNMLHAGGKITSFLGSKLSGKGSIANTKDKKEAAAEVNAFAGGEISSSTKVIVKAGGKNVGTFSGNLGVSYGLGGKVSAKLSWSNGNLAFGYQGSVAAGLGANFGYELNLNTDAVKQGFSDWLYSFASSAWTSAVDMAAAYGG